MNNKGTTLLIVILSILVIVAGGMLIYKIIISISRFQASGHFFAQIQ